MHFNHHNLSVISIYRLTFFEMRCYQQMNENVGNINKKSYSMFKNEASVMQALELVELYMKRSLRLGHISWQRRGKYRLPDSLRKILCQISCRAGSLPWENGIPNLRMVRDSISSSKFQYLTDGSDHQQYQDRLKLTRLRASSSPFNIFGFFKGSMALMQQLCERKNLQKC